MLHLLRRHSPRAIARGKSQRRTKTGGELDAAATCVPQSICKLWNGSTDRFTCVCSICRSPIRSLTLPVSFDTAISHQVQETQKLLSDPETDWKDCSSAIEELATAVECLGRSASHKDAVRLLLSLSVGIGMQLVSIRSKLVKDVCEHLLRVVKVTGQDFQDMANALLPQIVGTAKSASAAIRHPGAKLLCKMSEAVRYDLSLMRKIYVQLVQDKARVLVLEQLRIIFVYWGDNEVLQWEADILEIVRRGLEDQHERVRKTAREVLTRFSSRWSERVDELVDIPSNQSKALLISEHRDSPLAEAILNKYPELVNKSDSFSRSRSSFTQSRASFRKSPRHNREQNIEIHVSATPPPKQREQQETNNTEETTSTTSTRRTGAPPEITERERGAVSRRLFDNADFSDEADDDQQDDTLEVFDGSQMYGVHSKLTKSETGDIPSPPPAIPNRMVVAPSSTTSSVEEASLRYPDVRKLLESKIPSPLTRSPRILDKKLLGSPTGATSSPDLRPSMLPRPRSFTFKARGSDGPSTPVGGAKLEEENAETNPLSASDEYFSKPIPSSVATPTPSPPSTDNVTLRPRRRGFVHQEQEDSPLQNYAPELLSPSLQTPEELVRPRQVETTPESVICSSNPLEQEIAPALRGQDYGGNAIGDADEIGHLTEDRDHVESDTEWHHRRLNGSWSRSNSGSAEEDAEQSKPSGDFFRGEWHLDDGPRHKFDLDDEIGDRLSDEDQDQADYVGKPDGSETKLHENVGSSPLEYFTVQNDYEEEEVDEEDMEPTAVSKSENSPNDALTGLLNVRDEMSRLRAITRNDENSYGVAFEEREGSPTRCAVNAANASEESQDHVPETRTVQPSDEPSKKHPSYLQRLTHADLFARSPLIVPTADVPREEMGEQPSPLQTFEPTLIEVTASDGEHAHAHEELEESDFFDKKDLPPSPSLVFERATAKNDGPKTEAFDFVKESQFAENYSPRAESNACPQEIPQDHELYIDHDDQVGRFDAAERLFAAKDVPTHHAYHGTPSPPHQRFAAPQLSQQEHYMHSEPYQERYPAPTPMGAKLASAFANAQRNAMAKNGDDAPTDAPTDSMVKADNAEEETTPKPAQEQTVKETSPQSCQAESSFVESALPVSAESKHDTNPTRPTTTSPTTAKPERSPSPGKLSWISSFGISIVMLLSAFFCIAGILHAAKKVNESHEYHLDLKARIHKFEASIAESHTKVLKLEEDYAIWSEYVRKLTEEDEASAVTQLQAIQVEVQKWQQDMKEDLVQFRQALSVDSIEAAFANLRVNNTKQLEQ
ncbi:hypothetical protein PHYPSEUDO_007122 [Phytophthora pseudosyringae]|uniref:CLASP N-terminal domain-containing protein n=1 Tax=Phytophthora pseudosyringae TaxID=221518 RepID=A0A8T1WEN6_9STRA|nr:hypothetical protein PHYPSEUDO_007122 [Phytophthora pseudosyringae]